MPQLPHRPQMAKSAAAAVVEFYGPFVFVAMAFVYICLLFIVDWFMKNESDKLSNVQALNDPGNSNARQTTLR